MGFAQHAHQNYINQSSGGDGLKLFYYFSISQDRHSPYAQAPNGAHALYEDVWILSDFNELPIVQFHPTNKEKEQILSAETFDETKGTCPVKSAFDYWNKVYPKGQKGTPEAEARKKEMPIKAAAHEICIPVACPRRIHQKDTRIGSSWLTEVMPIYWMTLNITGYIDETRMNYESLKQAHENSPGGFAATPIRIFALPRPQGKKQQYIFQPLTQYDPAAMNISSIQHPIIQQFVDPNNNAIKYWNREYYDLMSHLPLIRYKPWVDPNTGQKLNYAGHLDTAWGYYNWTQENWPSPVNTVQNQAQQPQQQQIPQGVIMPQQAGIQYSTQQPVQYPQQSQYPQQPMQQPYQYQPQQYAPAPPPQQAYPQHWLDEDVPF